MNERCRDIFGFNAGGPLTLENLIEAVAPEKREEFSFALQLAKDHEPSTFQVYIVSRHSGKRRLAQGFNKIRLSANGKNYLMGIIIDRD